MDKQPQREYPAVLPAVATAAKAMGLQFDVVEEQAAWGRRRADALVRVGRGPHNALYLAEVRTGIRQANLGAVLHQLEQLGPEALLVADYVATELAGAFKDHRVAFIDAAGNAFLDQPNLLVWVTGRRPARPIAAKVEGRAFQPTGLQVLFVLLCDPAAANKPVRKLAEMAGVAHGTVGWVMTDLKAQGFVTDLKGRRNTRKIHHRDRLLDQWTDAYVRMLRPRTLIGRYYVPTIDDWQDWNLAENGAQWGGEPAAALLTQYLRPQELTIYAEQLPAKLALAKRFAKEPEPGRTAVVEVRRRFWNPEAAPHTEPTAPPVLVYADLLATRDARCLETAAMVRKQHVDRHLEDA